MIYYLGIALLALIVAAIVGLLLVCGLCGYLFALEIWQRRG